MSASLTLKATAGGSVTLTPPNTASNYVLTLPLGSGTLAGPNSTPVSVIDYGADPTGAVDSTTAIQNALGRREDGKQPVPERRMEKASARAAAQRTAEQTVST